MTVFFASGNAHKAAEMAALLAPAVQVVSAAGGRHPKVDETGATFRENARIKAAGWAQWLDSHGLFPEAEWVLADDSGLEVDALDGAPGVYSARFASGEPSGNSPDAANNAKLLRLLADVPPARRGARFRCALALVKRPVAEGAPALTFDGACEGRIAETPTGEGGFGYDPLFVPDGFSLSFAALGAGVKSRLSHRARAVAALRQWLAANPACR